MLRQAYTANGHYLSFLALMLASLQRRTPQACAELVEVSGAV
jgi:hypothetical protein